MDAYDILYLVIDAQNGAENASKETDDEKHEEMFDEIWDATETCIDKIEAIMKKYDAPGGEG